MLRPNLGRSKVMAFFLFYTNYLISKMDILKYIFQKLMSTGILAKFQIFLTGFEIMYVTQTVMKAQTFVAENPVDGDYC